MVNCESVCPICGKSFIKKVANQKYCSNDCRKENVRSKSEDYKWKYQVKYKQQRKEKKKKQRRVSLSDIMKQANKEGLQYGEYCLKYELY